VSGIGAPGDANAIVTAFYSDAYVLGGPAFDTTRKARWVADSLRARPIPGIVVEAPAPATADTLTAVHEPAYVEAVRTGEPVHLAESNGLAWDPGLYAAVSASTGGAAAAALRALGSGVAGSLSSGLHHAKRSHGDGFCTFNGLAVAARVALAAGTRGVLIVDLDAHCGGGTASLLRDEPAVAQLDIAVSAFDFYREPSAWTLDLVRQADEYLPTLRRRLDAVDASHFGLVLYNAGMDPFERCDVGGLGGMTRDVLAEREDAVFAWCRSADLPVGFVLAGGYTGYSLDQDELVDLHRLTLDSAARHARGHQP
jgi:acetoin utilization deacetylase AcuC-like enzyme